jgi:antitoxin HigA-1
VPPRRINEIVHEKRSITPDTALRLSKYFGTSAEIWMGLQSHYDLEVARDEFEKKFGVEVQIITADNKHLIKKEYQKHE